MRRKLYLRGGASLLQSCYFSVARAALEDLRADCHEGSNLGEMGRSGAAPLQMVDGCRNPYFTIKDRSRGSGLLRLVGSWNGASGNRQAIPYVDEAGDDR